MSGFPHGAIARTEPVQFARLEGPVLEADPQDGEARYLSLLSFAGEEEEAVEELPPERLDAGAEGVADAPVDRDDEVPEPGGVARSDAAEPPERHAGGREVEDVLAVEDRGGLVGEVPVPGAGEGGDDGGVVWLAAGVGGDLEGAEGPVRFYRRVGVQGVAQDELADVGGTGEEVEGLEVNGVVVVVVVLVGGRFDGVLCGVGELVGVFFEWVLGEVGQLVGLFFGFRFFGVRGGRCLLRLSCLVHVGVQSAG